MILEQRDYTVWPGKISQYLERYRAVGYELQASALGAPVLHAVTEIGELNQIVSVWAYEDLEDRRVRREQLGRMPEWQEFVGEVVPLIRRMDSRILAPTGFALQRG